MDGKEKLSWIISDISEYIIWCLTVCLDVQTVETKQSTESSIDGNNANHEKFLTCGQRSEDQNMKWKSRKEWTNEWMNEWTKHLYSSIDHVHIYVYRYQSGHIHKYRKSRLDLSKPTRSGPFVLSLLEVWLRMMIQTFSHSLFDPDEMFSVLGVTDFDFLPFCSESVTLPQPSRLHVTPNQKSLIFWHATGSEKVI
jgi:hypothetical protein